MKLVYRLYLTLLLALQFPQPVDASTISCTTVGACIMGVNGSSGPGIAGSSVSGFAISGFSKSGHAVDGVSASSFGVVGTTSVNATSAATARSGVWGKDVSTNKSSLNSGVTGSSNYGVGVTGIGGTYGGSFTSNYVYGLGLFAKGADLTGTVTIGETSADLGLVSYGGAAGLNVTIPGGVTYDDPNIETGGETALQVFGVANANGNDILFRGLGCYPNGVPDSPYSVEGCGDAVSFDTYGNGIFAGSVTQNGMTMFRTRSSTGADVASFAARSTSPTLEDVGKAELVNGIAHVALDREFASVMNNNASYAVFITPEGDSNSLYTTSRTAEGFIVKESKGGRSTLLFDYRVVAQSLGVKPMHLPAIDEFPQVKSFKSTIKLSKGRSRSSSFAR